MSYVKTEWQTGDLITADKINKIEDGIEVLSEGYEELKGDIVSLLGFIISKNDWKSGYYNGSGSYLDDGVNSNFTTRIIQSNEFEKIVVTPKSGYQLNVVTFNGTVFETRQGWKTDRTEITNGKNVAIILATTSPSSYSLDEMLENYEFEYTPNGKIENIENEISDIKKENDNIYYIAHLLNCDTNAKVLHFSFDDVSMCINSLINDNLSSIFDNYFLSDLKHLHEQYGCVFTLNCFNQNSAISGYNIANVPNKYASEFQANKSWLRFSFHAQDDIANYGDVSSYNIGINTAYGTFREVINTLTGSYDTIDRFIRLGFFGGTLPNIKDLKSMSYGVVGLYGADDTRLSYYLTETQNTELIRKGKYFDLDNQIILIRTLPRMDSNNAETIISKITLPYQKYVEVFGHEYKSYESAKYIEIIGDICEWANNKGFEHGYFDTIYD